MYKRSNQGWMKHIDFILWDVLILQGSYALGFMIRHGWGRWPYSSWMTGYRSLPIVLAIVDVLVAIVFNTMHNVIKRGYLKEAKASLKHVLLVLGIMSLYLFSTQEGDTYSRITIYLTAALHLVLGYGFRLLWKRFIKRFSKGKAKATMILVADEGTLPDILASVSTLDGFKYAGAVLSNRDAEGETVHGLKIVANLENAADYVCREWVDEVFIFPEKQDVSKLIEQCQEMAIPVHVHLPITSVSGKRFVEKIGGYNVLTMTANYADPLQLAIKRFMDILGGLAGSLIALVIIAVIGPRIKKESPGPILFKQTRIGLNGKKFTCYKIRSMYLDAEERKKELMAQNRVSDGMMFKLDWDPRIIGNRIVDGKQTTGIGEKIRSTSLDEFPQFFNILKGDMSLVGTRPPTEDEWKNYQFHHRARLATKPGLTGMWQVNGRSRITDFEEVVKLDTEYINNWSLGLDIKILLKTVRAVLKREGAM